MSESASKQDSLQISQKELSATIISKAIDPALMSVKGAEAARSLSPKKLSPTEKHLPAAPEPSRSIPSTSPQRDAPAALPSSSASGASITGADSRPIDTVDIDVSLADSDSDTDLSHTSGSDSSSVNTPKNEVATPKGSSVPRSDSKHAELTASPRITTKTAKDAAEAASLAPPGSKNRKTQRHSRLSANSAAVESTILAPLLRLRNHSGMPSSQELHQTLGEAVAGLSKLLKRCSSTSTEFLLQQLRKENQENAQQMDANTRRWLFSTLVEDDYVSEAVARELQLPNNLQLPTPSPSAAPARSLGDTTETESPGPNLLGSPPISLSRKPTRSRHVKFASMVAPRITESAFSALDSIKRSDSPVHLSESPRDGDGDRRPSRLELVTGSRRFLDGLRQKTDGLVPSRIEPPPDREQPRSADPMSSSTAAPAVGPIRSLRRSSSNDDLLSRARRHFNFEGSSDGKRSPETPPEVKAKELLRSSDELSMTPRLNSPHRMNSLSNDTSLRPLSFTSVGIFSDALGRVHLADPPHEALNPENASLYRQKGIIYGFQTTDLFRVHRSPPTGLRGAAPIVEEAKPGDWVIISDEDGIGVCPKSEFGGQYEAIAGKRNMYRKSSCALTKVVDVPQKSPSGSAPSTATPKASSSSKPDLNLSITVPQKRVLVRLLDAVSSRQLSNAIGVAWANVKQSLPTDARTSSPPSSVRTILSGSPTAAEYFLFDQQYFEDKFLPAKGATRTSVLSVIGSPRSSASPTTPVDLMSPANATRTRQFSAMFDNVFLPKSVKHAIEHQLERALDWTFDIFSLDRLCDGHTLYYLGFYMFEAFDLIEKFDISENSLKNFLYEMEAAYKANPYHNSIHGADVMQSTIHFVRHGINLMTAKSNAHKASLPALPSIDEQIPPATTAVSDLQFLALVLSALMHDVAHPGLTNNFLVNTDHALALEYNDKSVLENFHIATGFGILRKDNCSILSNVSPSQRKELRGMMIKLVLATDLAFHFDTLTQFKAKWLTNDLQPSDPQSQILLMKIALKCADIGHPLKPQPIHLKWSQRCFEEFYNQGDEERSRGLPITACCDRYDKKEGKSQKGFLDFLVRPLITAFCDVVGNRMWLSYLEQNDQYWTAKLKAAEAKEASLRSAVLQRAAATQGTLQLPEPRPASAATDRPSSSKTRKSGNVPRNVAPSRALPHSMSTDLKAARSPLSLTQPTPKPKSAAPAPSPPPAAADCSTGSCPAPTPNNPNAAAPAPAPAHPVRMITSKSDGAPASPSPPSSPPLPSGPAAATGSLATRTPSDSTRRDSQSGRPPSGAPLLVKAPTIPARPADPSASQKKRQYVDELRRAFSNPKLETTVSEDVEDGSEPPSADAEAKEESKPQPKPDASASKT